VVAGRSDGQALGRPYVARRRNYSRPGHNKAGFAAFEIERAPIRADPHGLLKVAGSVKMIEAVIGQHGRHN
jgi:hypothetical protein